MNIKKFVAVAAGFLIVAVALPVFAQTTISSYGYAYAQPVYNCPALSYNLYRGLSDYHTQGQVSQVQRFLSTRYYQPVTGYYGAITWSNVASFQREQGLWPVTGGVGPLTRAAIARVCSGTPVPPPVPPPYPTPVPSYPTYNAPSINGVSGPSQLTVGQSGTWVLSVADNSSYLSYSVVWGDEQVYPYAYAASSPQAVQSSGSLSHTYSQPGTYSPRFTVTNQYGQSATASASVVVSGAQTTNTTFSAYPASGVAPLAVTFSVRGLSSTDTTKEYSVDFGDGTSGQVAVVGQRQCFAFPCESNIVEASHTYTSKGTFAAKLIYQPPFYCPPGLYCAQMMPAPRVVGTATVTVY